MVVLLSALSIRGQAQTNTPESFFNQASKEYVKEDKLSAMRTLDKGLQQFPGDARMLKLAEELLKEQQQQQQEQQQQQQQQQDQKDQQKQDEKDGQNGNEQKQEQNEPDGEQGKEQQEQQKKQEQQAQRQQQNQNGQAQPGAIAPQDAMRMLDALERSEKDIQDRVRAKRRPASRRTIEKDW